MKEDMIIQYVEEVLKPYEVASLTLVDEREYDIYEFTS